MYLLKIAIEPAITFIFDYGYPRACGTKEKQTEHPLKIAIISPALWCNLAVVWLILFQGNRVQFYLKEFSCHSLYIMLNLEFCVMTCDLFTVLLLCKLIKRIVSIYHISYKIMLLPYCLAIYMVMPSIFSFVF